MSDPSDATVREVMARKLWPEVPLASVLVVADTWTADQLDPVSIYGKTGNWRDPLRSHDTCYAAIQTLVGPEWREFLACIDREYSIEEEKKPCDVVQWQWIARTILTTPANVLARALAEVWGGGS